MKTKKIDEVIMVRREVDLINEGLTKIKSWCFTIGEYNFFAYWSESIRKWRIGHLETSYELEVLKCKRLAVSVWKLKIMILEGGYLFPDVKGIDIQFFKKKLAEAIQKLGNAYPVNKIEEL